MKKKSTKSVLSLKKDTLKSLTTANPTQGGATPITPATPGLAGVFTKAITTVIIAATVVESCFGNCETNGCKA